MATKKPKSNSQFVRDLMENTPNALVQVFILDAITKHADRVAAMPVAEVRAAFGKLPLVNPDAWHAAAKEISQRIQAR